MNMCPTPIRYLRKSYPAFKSFFIVSNHFFFTQSNYWQQTYITELDSNWNSRHYLCSSHTFVLFASGYFQGFHILHNPDSSSLIIFKTLAYPDSNQSFARHWHIHTLINHLQDLGISRLWTIVWKTWAYQDSDQLFARFGHIRTLFNHLQDLGISGLRSIIARLWHNRISINH